MQYLFAIITCISASVMQVSAHPRCQVRDTKNVRSHSSIDLAIHRPYLFRRGSAISKTKQTEDRQTRRARLNAETPTSQALARANSGWTSRSRNGDPTAGQVLISGPFTSSWSRTQDEQKLKHPPHKQHLTSISHSLSSAVGGESYKKEGQVSTAVEGRRVESHVKVGKGSSATMNIDLGGQMLKGNIGPKAEAHIKLRHPDANKKFALSTKLTGKGYLASQGQGYFGSSDVSDHDSASSTAGSGRE